MINFTFPKVELHLHIDCSLSFNFVSKVLPEISREEYERVYNTPVDCCSLNDYLACAKAAIALMQTREQIFDATLDVIHQLEQDHVIYGELRFAPLQHLENGLTPEEVVEASIDAVKSYQGPVKVNLILCTLRHFTREQSDLTADLVIKYHQQGVVALDLAADEVGFNLENHAAAFEKVRQHKIPCTAHAGEARGAESVIETLSLLQTKRIGHGIRSVEDPALMERLKSDRIHLEICPTSNHITQVYPKGENYPIEKLKEAKVSFGINTDGRAISNVTLADEYAWLVQNKAWTIDDMFQANVDALNAAFISNEERSAMMNILLLGFQSTGLGPETKINIYAGNREFIELSNFAKRPFDYSGDGEPDFDKEKFGGFFETVEGAFQAQKVRFLDPNLFTESPRYDAAMSHIARLRTCTGSQAKIWGQEIQGLNRDAWNAHSSRIMKSLLMQSFQQNPYAFRLLLATGNATLTHHQRNEDAWSVKFPKLLMEVREELRRTRENIQS